MNIGTILTEVLDEGSQNIPSGNIVGGTSHESRRIVSIAHTVLDEMVEEYNWRELRRRGSITLVDGQSTYSLPTDFSRYHYNTFWNHANSLPVIFIDEQYISATEALGVNSYSTTQFYIDGIADNQITIKPTPNAATDGNILKFFYTSTRSIKPRTWESGLTISSAGEYISYNGNYYTSTNTGTTGATPPTHTTGTASDGTVSWAYYSGGYNRFIADTDEPVLSATILKQGILERMQISLGLQVKPTYMARLRALYSKQKGHTPFYYGASSKSVNTSWGQKVFFRTR